MKLLFTILLSLVSLNAGAKDSSGNVVDLVKKSMDYYLQKQVVISQNISAAQVPGYKTKELKKVDFEKISNDENSIKLNLAVTSGMHIDTRNRKQDYLIIKDRNANNNLIAGNNVDLESEMQKASENNTDYNLSLKLYNKITSMVKVASK